MSSIVVSENTREELPATGWAFIGIVAGHPLELVSFVGSRHDPRLAVDNVNVADQMAAAQ
jgi:hypothetical protein